MAIEAVKIEKTYTIDGSVFKLKNFTLGINRKSASLVSLLTLKIQELSAISGEYLNNAEQTKADDENALRKLYGVGERVNKITEEIFIKAEELFNLILEPVEPQDIKKLVADNIDSYTLLQVVKDYIELNQLRKK